MNEVYLTPNLYIKNNVTYYIDDDKHREICVNNNNWHKYMCEYGWSKIDRGWIRRLNQYCIKKNKNSSYGILDCGGDGDCLFYTIAEAVGEIDMQVIRDIAADQITDDNYDMIIETYRTSHDADEFDCNWNPYNIKNKDDLKKELKKAGHNYWGDHVVIQLLSIGLCINFIILNSENEELRGKKKLEDRFRIHCMGNDIDPSRKTIILYYEDDSHFKLIGHYSDNRMITLFDELPVELWNIYREDCSKN